MSPKKKNLQDCTHTTIMYTICMINVKHFVIMFLNKQYFTPECPTVKHPVKDTIF